MYKIVPFQFSFPGFARLVTPYGQTTPETLLWTFMGASQAYTAVVGVGELAAGVLLLFRRTALLGALLGVGVLLNIVLLNFFYIGGGKIFTVHLLLFALLIVAPSARLLTGVLLGTAGADSRSSSKPIPAVMYGGLAALIALVVMVRFGSQAQEARRNFGDLQPQSPLHGLYDVTEFALNGVPKPPLYTDPARWRRVAIESPRGMFVFGGDDSRRFLPTNVDASLGLVRTGRPGSPHEGTLRYSRTAEGWVLRGVFGADSLMVRLRRLDTAEFPLVRHQFRWVRDNEG
jgi:hypothetical protein